MNITIYLRNYRYLILFILIGNPMVAQVGIGTLDPDKSSILDITSSTKDKGILIPRVDIPNLTSQAPITETAAVGLLVYNTNTTTGVGFYYWKGANWVKFIIDEDDNNTNLYTDNGIVADNYRTINLDNHIFGYINNITDNDYLYLSPAGVNSDEFYWSSSTGHGFAVGTKEAFIIDADRMATLISNSSPVTPTTGSLIIKHQVSDGTGVSSIVFPSGSNRGSDYGYISYEDDGSINGTTNENGLFTIGIANDGTGTSDTDRDNLNIVASGSVGISNKGPNQQAALDLGQINKGLLINRVALTSITSKDPIYGNQADMPESLLVYNTATAGTSPNNVVPGYYYWKDNQWINLRDNEEQNIYTSNGAINEDRTLDLNNKALDYKNGTIGLFRFQSNGSLKLKKYGSTVFAANPANMLGVTTTGDVVEINTDKLYANANKDWYKASTTAMPTSINDNIYTNGKVSIGKTSAYGALHLYENTGSVPNFNGGTLTLEHGNAGGESSIVFRSKNNGDSDYAYMRYEEDYDGSSTGSAENGKLTIGIGNDGEGSVEDDIEIKSSGIIDYTLGNNANSTYTMTANAFYPGTNGTKSLGLTGNRWGETWLGNVHYNTITADSDRRLKENIESLDMGMDLVSQLKTYSYNFKSDTTKSKRYGFMAQDLLKILPAVVSVGTDPEKLLGVNYIEMIPILVNAIKEQQTTIESQNTKIKNLETAVAEIRQRLDKE